jgi:hypothetical protein
MQHASPKSHLRSGAGPEAQVAHPPDAPEVSDEAIAKRAYDKFVARGSVDGCHLEDWTQARNELLAERHKD